MGKADQHLVRPEAYTTQEPLCRNRIQNYEHKIRHTTLEAGAVKEKGPEMETSLGSG
jgi:hypothetical protein